MRDAAHQFGLRPAAVDAAVPQPQVIGQQLRDAAFADTVEKRDVRRTTVAGDGPTVAQAA